jgi:hypothetical protein
VLLPTTKYQRANQVRFYEDALERVARARRDNLAVSAMPLHDGAAGALPFNVEDSSLRPPKIPTPTSALSRPDTSRR